MSEEIKEAFETWYESDVECGVGQACLAAFRAGVAWQKQQCDAEIARLREALLDMVWQFCSNGERLSHSFMSAEELAFSVLNLENGMTYEQAVKGSDDGRS